MKKFTTKSLALILASTSLFSACNSDEDVSRIIGPSMELISQLDEEYIEGVDIDLKYAWSAPGKIGQVKLEIFIDGNSASNTTFTNTELGYSEKDSVGNIDFTITVPEDGAGSLIEIDATLIDRENQSIVSSTAFEVIEVPLKVFSTTLLAAPTQDLNGTTASKTSKTFFSTNTGLRYSMAEINQSSEALSSNVDFGYFYGSGTTNTEATIAAPNHYPIEYGQAAWASRNETTLRKTNLTESDFNEANAKFISTSFDNGTAGVTAGRIANIEAGDVLAFETSSTKAGGSKRGLLLVESIQTGSGSEGEIAFSIVMQE